MTIIVQCDCGKKYKVGDDKAGKKMRCKECNGVVAIPIPKTEPADKRNDFGDGEFDDFGGGDYGGAAEVASRPHRDVQRKSRSKVLIITICGAGILCLVIIGIVVIWAFFETRQAARRVLCKDNLNQIIVAMYAYEEEYGVFPPAYIADKRGKPMHSWRVLILPFLKQKELYKQYRMDEPWDGPNNRTLAERMPEIFRCPSAEATSPMTHYMTIRDPESIFPGTKPNRMRDITDGVANTIAVVETPGKTVHWMSPNDVSPEEFLRRLTDAEGGDHHHQGGTHVAMANSEIRFLSSKTSHVDLKALITREGGEISPPAEPPPPE